MNFPLNGLFISLEILELEVNKDELSDSAVIEIYVGKNKD